MQQHLLRVRGPVVKFERLIAALRQERAKVGWLELGDSALSEAPRVDRESLEAAAGFGVLRAVAIGGGRTVAIKPMRGAPVLRDVLREHYRGCCLVLVEGEVDAPELEPDGETWLITVGDRAAKRWTTEKLIAALRRPSPWD
ncbi:MAG: hypothetical protein AAF560_10410 [Acidobacteriota bacterium]